MRKTTVTQIPQNKQPAHGLTRRRHGLMALEQRFMFDGAAVAEAADKAIDLQLVPNATWGAASPALEQAQIQAEQVVSGLLANAGARDALLAAFAGGAKDAQASAQRLAAIEQLLSQSEQGQTPLRVELRSNAELQGAKGAYSATGTTGQATVYLNAEWAATADEASLTRVLVEEMGHHLDALINGQDDTPGDEGELFARMVLEGVQPQSVSFLLSEDDHAALSIEGQQVLAELAAFQFVNAYEMVYDQDGGNDVDNTETWASKEQSSHYFNATNPLGSVRITDGTNGQNFSGNDVSASAIVIGGETLYGWISRPIKANGIVRGFYFWTDTRFASLADAQTDNNMDGDSLVTNNRGFVLVVDQTWFTSQITKTGQALSVTSPKDGNLGPITMAEVGSSSDRVDSALNEVLLLAPVPLSITANNVVEGATPSLTYTITLSRQTTAPSVYPFSFTGGTGFTAADYTSTQFSNGVTLNADGTITVPTGVTSFTFTVTAQDDESPEGTEYATVQVGGVSATGSVTDVGGSVISLTVTGKDDVSEGSPSVFDVSLSQAYDADKSITLTLGDSSTETGDYGTTMTVTYTPLEGSPVSVSVVSGSSFSLPAGVTDFKVKVDTTVDGVYEGPEVFTLTAAVASGPSGSDTSTILDNGQGKVYDSTGTATLITPDDDRPTLTVTGKDDVAEGSPSVFDVQLSKAYEGSQLITLTLGNTTAESDDYSASMVVTYVDPVTTATVTLTVDSTQSFSLPAGVTNFKVRVTTDGDTTYEGAETFSLTAAVTNGPSGSDTSTILDNGTGTVYNNDGTASVSTPQDDRAITVTGLDDVSEGSNVIFTVNLPDGNTKDTEITLALTDVSTESADYTATYTAYYYVGATQTALTIDANNKVVLPANVTTFYVKVVSAQDTTLEGGEDLKLTATITAGKSANDTSTIVDDGTGKTYDDKGTNGAGPGNDDRAITVTGLDDVSEGSNAVFKVTLETARNAPTEITLALANGNGSNDAAESSDYVATYSNDGSDATKAAVYYYVGSVQTFLAVTDGKINLPANVTEFFVRVPTTQDGTYEIKEDFQLTATVTNGKSGADTSTIVDDGTGKIYDDKGVNPTGPGDDDRPKAPPPPPAPLPPAPIVMPAYVPEPLPSRPQVFNSVLQPLGPRLVPVDVPPPIGDVLTSQSGYRIPVNESAAPGLSLNRGVTDQFVKSTDMASKISLPFDAFIHSNKDAVIKLEAKQTDNSSLPNWVQFDPVSGVFTVTPPKGFKGKLDLKVVARDDDGREATALFQLFVGEQDAPRPQSREGLSEKLKLAGKRGVQLVRVGDVQTVVVPREALPQRVRAG